MRFLITAIGLIALSAIKLEAAPGLLQKVDNNCFIQHLKTLKKLEENYPEYGVEVSDDYCQRIISSEENELYDRFTQSMISQNLNQYANCVISQLKSQSYAVEAVLRKVYEASEQLSETEREVKLAKVDERIAEMSMATVQICVFETEYGKVFDDTISAAYDDDDKTNYCLRKYVVDRNLIDLKVHNIIINPKDIDISSFDCEGMLKTYFRNSTVNITEGENLKNLNDEQKQCIKGKFREGKYAGKVLAVIVLSEISMNDEQKAAERTKFINSMSEFFKQLQWCQLNA